MRFLKGHGTGNDFVILPDEHGQLPLTPSLVAALCDRRRGIGADGVLRVVRAAHHPDGARFADQAEWFMDYWNADGSFAEMCGNGVRVFVRYLDSVGVRGSDGALPVATRAGVVRAVIDGDSIAVDMGRPRLTGTSAATLDGRTFPGVVVDCGNPHLVCTLPDDVDLSSLDLTQAPGFDPRVFPAGVNVEFVTPTEGVGGADLHRRMRVYERGSAETLSCGSGACAVAAVAVRDAGRTDGVVAVDVPGGRLRVTLDGESCWLAGPAVLVARGEVDLNAISG
ncbi:MAG: diaminopimelate epimerase [Actinobacteria bacterium]|nr:MAG: diaminopimelate epimerase [Actinomycetota bacterium]